jgi:hypothetical protein
MFYKLNVGNSPEFLCDLIPPSVGETNNYNLRRAIQAQWAEPLVIVVLFQFVLEGFKS